MVPVSSTSASPLERAAPAVGLHVLTVQPPIRSCGGTDRSTGASGTAVFIPVMWWAGAAESRGFVIGPFIRSHDPRQGSHPRVACDKDRDVNQTPPDYHRAHYLANRAPLTKKRRLQRELDAALECLNQLELSMVAEHIERARAIFEPEDDQ